MVQSTPWGIVYTCIATAIMGFVYLLGLLYSTVDVAAALAADNAAIAAYVNACGKRVGHVLANLLISNFFLAGER
jgi:hypothetical protein